jgi:membrane protein
VNAWFDHWLGTEARERARDFAWHLWLRFRDDKCFEAAGALSYTTLFALVPLTTAVFGVIAAFPVFKDWSDRITDFVFVNFVPAAGPVVRGYLEQFAANASKLTSAGVIALIVSALLMMSSVEDTYNRIWRAPYRRRRWARFVAYWTVLTLGPILVAASLGLSSALLSWSWLRESAGAATVMTKLWALLPATVTWAALSLSYQVMPNCPVRFRHAALGAGLATVLFEAAKVGFARFLAQANFAEVYGALAVVPIFLVWIYVSWSVVLLGASLAASLSAYRFLPQALRVSPGLEFVALLRVLRSVAQGTRDGAPPTRADLAAGDPGLTDVQLDRFLDELQRTGLIVRGEAGQWLAQRDPVGVRVRELFEAGGYRWPHQAELTRLAQRAGATAHERAWCDWFTSGCAAQAQHLDASLASVLALTASNPPSQTMSGAT